MYVCVCICMYIYIYSEPCKYVNKINRENTLVIIQLPFMNPFTHSLMSKFQVCFLKQLVPIFWVVTFQMLPVNLHVYVHTCLRWPTSKNWHLNFESHNLQASKAKKKSHSSLGQIWFSDFSPPDFGDFPRSGSAAKATDAAGQSAHRAADPTPSAGLSAVPIPTWPRDAVDQKPWPFPPLKKGKP